MSGTVLNITEFPKADGGGILRRTVTDKEGAVKIVDFWAHVIKADSPKLEAILKLAVTDSNYDLTHFIRMIEYQGFDRLFYIKLCLSKMSVSLFCRFAILGAIRGSNFKRISERCEQMPEDMTTAFADVGFIKTPKKKDDITILRCTASIPHWCAYYMNKAKVEAKILSSKCPSCIQFPAAASLPMSKEVRISHIEFCIAFSSLLPGGAFKVSIYLTAMANLIPVNDIPTEILSILKVSSAGESYKLTEDEVTAYDSQMVKKK